MLGPRSSSGLSAMLKELQSARARRPICSWSSLKDVRFFSPSATAEDTFLLDRPPALETPRHSRQTDESVEKLFARAQIRLTRTIGTDAILAEQLVQELKRRQVDLKPCAARDCNPKVALISEWDTLYGRSLPRTFAAVAMNQRFRHKRRIAGERNRQTAQGRMAGLGLPAFLSGWAGRGIARHGERQGERKKR